MLRNFGSFYSLDYVRNEIADDNPDPAGNIPLSTIKADLHGDVQHGYRVVVHLINQLSSAGNRFIATCNADAASLATVFIQRGFRRVMGGHCHSSHSTGATRSKSGAEMHAPTHRRGDDTW